MTTVRVIDFETTGFEPKFEVCEAAYCDYDVDNKTVSEDYTSWLCGVDVMPPDVRAVHHITKDECDGNSKFNPDDMDGDHVNVFCAHNAEFEQKFFQSSKPFICTYKSALRVWPDAPSHSNGVLRYWLEDQGKITPDAIKTQPAHRAGPDAYVTACILKALFDEGITGKQMVQWSKEPRLLSKCPIGKFRGCPWSDVDVGFLGWMIKQSDMEYDLKWNAEREIKRRTSL